MIELKPCAHCGRHGSVYKTQRGGLETAFRGQVLYTYGGWKCACSNESCLLHVTACEYESEWHASNAWNRRTEGGQDDER